jgi:hypothetical protein
MIATKEQILLTLNILKAQRLGRFRFDGAPDLIKDMSAFDIYNTMIKRYSANG